MSDKADNKYSELARVAGWYDTRVDFDRYLIAFKHRSIREHLCGDAVLEMGCASGIMTRLFMEHLPQLDVVEGAIEYIDAIKHDFDNRVTFHHSLWEDFEARNKYSDIILAGALEHIEQPVDLLKKIRNWLRGEAASAIHLTVPNANSLHRHIGVAMKLIESTKSLSERDVLIGHQRVYDQKLLSQHVSEASLKITHHEGIYLKPLPHSEMEQWPLDRIEAFYEVGKSHSDICAEIYVKCEPA